MLLNQNLCLNRGYSSNQHLNYNFLNCFQQSRISQEKDSFSKKSSTYPQVQTNSLVVRKATCSINCPGARRIPPTMQCINCRCFYHAKCQGVSVNVKVCMNYILNQNLATLERVIHGYIVPPVVVRKMRIVRVE